ncbi:outer membrane protein assembly factor BamB [Hydrogenophaga sp.]|nr:outer membrane protein assembly factor BamB [Hydrogenophaga sp.]
MAAAMVLAACSSGPVKMKPAELAPVANRASAQLIWSTQMGLSSPSMAPLAHQGRVYLTGSKGTVAAVDATSGRDVWRLNLGTSLSTGAGSDGQTTAVVTQGNQLIAMADGRESWRVQLSAASFTAPLVAGRRVFVLAADRSVIAFDAQNGARLWTQARPGEPLVLRQSGVLLAVGDTLVAGLSGRLVGLNPLNGTLRWEASIANSRGTNEVERLVDLVGSVSRIGNSVCARSFNSAVGCVDTDTGRLLWSKPAQGVTGVHGDEQYVFGSETDGRLMAWQRAKGDRAWEVDRLKFRELTAPLALGRLLVVGDGTGLVHLLSREDGSELTRLTTDGSPILAAPVLSGPALVVQTLNGGVYAWRSQ